MFFFKKLYLLFALILFTIPGKSQNKQGIYVDASGIIRWEKDNSEAAFFGTNYTAPFAYGNRAIIKIGQRVEQAIKDDVYHFSRLGFDAFRVHVWDQEIADAKGNLINNEHLRLFDFLIAELKKRKIKILITPIAFWGNGYPERDEKTGSFSNIYGKQKSLTEEEAFVAQENYLKQFFLHKNPYTGLTYQQDVDILATEINNEPQHSGAKERATEYINRMVKAVKSTGWTKPIFYNISESPWYADAIVKADVQGHSFQWYPTGLVAGHTLRGNYLPNVSQYKIPFDSIPAFNQRAKIVYEFDAGDVADPIMYPAMARSFRAAGFQWATQFAYDPMSTAYANTEYQTHYLNLAYTPAKAISMLIASKIFHQYKRLDTLNNKNAFGSFKIDYKNSLSEMNSGKEFYYSNTTSSNPISPKKLVHIAGVGASKLIKYHGTGAYFLDKISEGLWRLEVMPDAIRIKDPFEKASPEKTVTSIQWAQLPIEIYLPDLGVDFSIKGLNLGNTYDGAAENNSFMVSPGTYLLTKKGVKTSLSAKNTFGVIALGEFVAPKQSANSVSVAYEPLHTVTENAAFKIAAVIAGLVKGDTVFVRFPDLRGIKEIQLQEVLPYHYSASLPAEFVKSGLLKYQIIVRQSSGGFVSFPSERKGNPDNWDWLDDRYYQTYVAVKQSILELFNASSDGNNINIYNPDWSHNRISYVSAENPSVLSLKLTMGKPSKGSFIGFQSFFANKLTGRQSEISNFETLVIKVRSSIPNIKVKVGLIDAEAHFFATSVTASDAFQLIEIPLEQLKPDSQLLLPRPYPGFLPLYYTSMQPTKFNLGAMEKLEVTFVHEASEQPVSIDVESIFLK